MVATLKRIVRASHVAFAVPDREPIILRRIRRIGVGYDDAGKLATVMIESFDVTLHDAFPEGRIGVLVGHYRAEKSEDDVILDDLGSLRVDSNHLSQNPDEFTKLMLVFAPATSTPRTIP